MPNWFQIVFHQGQNWAGLVELLVGRGLTGDGHPGSLSCKLLSFPEIPEFITGYRRGECLVFSLGKYEELLFPKTDHIKLQLQTFFKSASFFYGRRKALKRLTWRLEFVQRVWPIQLGYSTMSTLLAFCLARVSNFLQQSFVLFKSLFCQYFHSLIEIAWNSGVDAHFRIKKKYCE